jgi:hypothetical protein
LKFVVHHLPSLVIGLMAGFDWLMCEPDGYMIYTINRCCDRRAASITRSLPNQPAQS